jgi:nucleoside-diphosphate-sugar epimerase
MLLDITRIRRDTGWGPRMTSLEAVKETARQLVRELGVK